MSMQPAMLPSEIALLRSALCCSKHYVEFGTGVAQFWLPISSRGL
jgi:hypothetical protein